MLNVGDKVIHYVDDIEGYRMFKVIKVQNMNRYVLKGVDTKTTLNRILDNNQPDKRFHYMQVIE